MSIYAIVNQDTCIGCGNCRFVAPEAFGNNDEGISLVLIAKNMGTEKIPAHLADSVLDALEDCPTGSIYVENAPFQND